MTRREHIQKLGVLGLLPLLSSSPFRMEENIIQRTIPGTNESLPIVGIGTWETFDVDDNSVELPNLEKVLRILLEKGGKVVDSSPMYGFAEKRIGQLSSKLDVNNKLFIATKVWTRGKEEGIRQMNNSLSLLQRSTLDLMQIHNLEDWKTHMSTLRAWKEQGKLRYIGITHYREPAYKEMESIMNSEPIDFIQVNYNLAERQADKRLLPLAKEKNIGVIISQPFGYGKLFQKIQGKKLPVLAEELGCKTWAQFFLKFIVSHPAVTCAIPGTGNPEHMLDNIAAAFGPLPDEKQRQLMIQAI